MGGRVAQKYVEIPLLLPRRSQTPRLSKDSACLDRSIHRRRRLKLGRGSTHGWQTLGVECGAKTRRRGDVEKTGAHSPDTCEAVESYWDQLTVVDKDRRISNGETGSPSGRPEDDTHSYAGDTEHMDIDPDALAGERKFDIRTWVLVTGWDPLEAFVFDEGYLRVCPQNFTLDESKFAEPQVHLTNLSARRPNKHTSTAQFQQQDEGQQRRPSSSTAGFRAVHRDKGSARETTDAPTSEAENDGFVASQAQLIRRLGEMDEAEGSGETKKGGEEEVRARGERIWRSKVSPAIEGIVRSTLFAAQPHMRPRAPSFQLFGFDLILDRQLRPCE